jgi:DNA-binding response OmpR family regulator
MLMTKLQARKHKPRHQQNWSAAAIEAGDFSIDLATRSVMVRGQELQLTSAEFEMLVFLTGHHKSVVTPNTMLATNWSGREVRQAEFVRVLISLRKKLDSVTGSTPSYIRTESWIFYNFSPTLAHRV